MGRLEKLVGNVSLLLLFQLLAVLTKAEDTTYVQRFDMYARNLSKQEMRTTILYDRVCGIGQLNSQQHTAAERESIPKDYKYWKQIYLEMYNADYTNATKLNFEDSE